MGPGEIIEGAIRNDSHRTAGRMCRLGHRVEAAVAANCNHRSIALQRPHRCRGGYLCQIAWVAAQQLALASVAGQGSLDDRAFGIEVQGTRRGVDHEQQGRCRVNGGSRRAAAPCAVRAIPLGG
ncbi:hypothetical protein SDC9_159372 [bioreactor metagenome]|uniref:Uncharacterized protein n=1 Tax=bioreactor metagenome TaxID=1076179 RepID=A0A645FF04_9ZZZZ